MSLQDSEPVKKQTGELPPYSVLMSVYAKDRPEWFLEAVVSMAEQTWKPAEILVMEDGALPPELQEAKAECEKRYPGLLRFIPHDTNRGLAVTLAEGVRLCRCEWIARMDADDLSDLTRCEKELELAGEEKADLVSCGFVEFSGTPDSVIARRMYPRDHDSLVRLSRRRSPVCHAAAMMKKDAVLRAGNYRDLYVTEDYDLFVRMLACGCKACTVNEYLYCIRAGKAYYNRRSGWKYLKSVLRCNADMVRSGWCSWTDFAVRSASMTMVCLAPGWFRTWFYKTVLRN